MTAHSPEPFERGVGINKQLTEAFKYADVYVGVYSELSEMLKNAEPVELQIFDMSDGALLVRGYIDAVLYEANRGGVGISEEPEEQNRLFLTRYGDKNGPISVVWNNRVDVETSSGTSYWFNGFTAHYYKNGFARVFEPSQPILTKDELDVAVDGMPLLLPNLPEERIRILCTTTKPEYDLRPCELDLGKVLSTRSDKGQQRLHDLAQHIELLEEVLNEFDGMDQRIPVPRYAT